jgi:hypothetical protein
MRRHPVALLVLALVRMSGCGKTATARRTRGTTVWRMKRASVSLVIAVASALMAALIAATALHAPGARAALVAPAQIVRTYTGKVTVATGRYAHASGLAVVHLTLTTGRGEPVEARRLPPGGQSRPYEASLVLRGQACPERGARHVRPRCLTLDGTLNGEGKDEEQHIPDTGGSIRFTAGSPMFPSLGPASAKCLIWGVGYIRSGRRGIAIVLVGEAGTVWITARGPVVPGFSGL